VNDLCELVALISLTPAAGTPADVRLNELAAAWSLRELQFAKLVPKQSEIDAQRVVAISRYKKLTGQSEAWFVDIVSDANGV
ncbi:hypothetical protein ABTD53_19520, partial [Acinetobacter baumannii]